MDLGSNYYILLHRNHFNPCLLTMCVACIVPLSVLVSFTCSICSSPLPFSCGPFPRVPNAKNNILPEVCRKIHALIDKETLRYIYVMFEILMVHIVLYEYTIMYIYIYIHVHIYTCVIVKVSLEIVLET